MRHCLSEPVWEPLMGAQGPQTKAGGLQPAFRHHRMLQPSPSLWRWSLCLPLWDPLVLVKPFPILGCTMHTPTSADFYSYWFPPSTYCVLYRMDLIYKEEDLSLKPCTWLSNAVAWGQLLRVSLCSSPLRSGVHFINLAGLVGVLTEKTHIMHLESGRCSVNIAFLPPRPLRVV